MIEWEKYAPKNKSSTSKFRNEFPYRKEAEELAKKGRFGDTMVMHVNPAEVELLAQFAPGGITINPETGQPEAFLPLLLGIIPAITGALATIGPALMAGIGAIGSGLGAVGGMIGTGLGAVGGAASSVLGSIGSGISGFLGGGAGAGAAAAPSSVLATVPTATAEAALASAGTAAGTIATPAQMAFTSGLSQAGAAATPAWMSGAGTGMSSLGMSGTGAALPGSFGSLAGGGAAFTPAVLPGAIPTGIINPALMGGQVPMNTGSMLAQTGSQMTPEMFTALQNAQSTQGLSAFNAANSTSSLANAPGVVNPIGPGSINAGSIANAPTVSPLNVSLSNPTPINTPVLDMVPELASNIGEPLTIGESIAGMSDSSKLMALLGAGSLIDSLASDDFESEEEEYVNSYGAEYRPSWKENPYSRNTRRLEVGPGGSPDNIKPRYYGSGIG